MSVFEGLGSAAIIGALFLGGALVVATIAEMIRTVRAAGRSSVRHELHAPDTSGDLPNEPDSSPQ